MKLQVEGQAMRLRINEAELAQLRAGNAVENCSELGLAQPLQVRIVLSAHDSASWRNEGGVGVLQLPRSTFEAFIERLPCRDGLRLQFAIGQGRTLSLGFEVDVRDSLRQRGARPRR